MICCLIVAILQKKKKPGIDFIGNDSKDNWQYTIWKCLF